MESKLKELSDTKSLSNIPVNKFMSTNVIKLTHGCKVQSAIKIFKVNRIGGMPIVNSNNELTGILSQYDLLMQVATQSMDAEIKYVTEVISIRDNATFKEALVLLYKSRCNRLPVVNERRQVVGIVSRIDILSLFLKDL